MGRPLCSGSRTSALQRTGLVGFQRCTGCRAILGIIAAQFREDREDFLADFFVQPAHALFARVVAFRSCTVRGDDLVLIKEHVEVFHFLALFHVDRIAIYQVFGRCQDFLFTEHQFRTPIRNQHPVQRADAQVAIVVQRTGFDDDRRNVADTCHLA